jgi:hypothetical protein
MHGSKLVLNGVIKLLLAQVVALANQAGWYRKRRWPG